MKISKFRTIWIALLSIKYTAATCGKAICMRLVGRISRPWVDATLHKWVDNLLKLFKVSCKVINPHKVEPIPGKPTIIMCNHSSLFDIPLSFRAFPKHSIRMLAKKELAKIPIMGGGMTAAEFLFIDRKNRHQALADLKLVQELLHSGIIMWIAPEGTRSKTGLLAPFKKGAFITAIETKATIIPIGIRGAFDIIPAGTLQFNLNQQAEIHIGKAIDAGLFELDNKSELIQKVYDEIKRLTGEIA